MRKYNKEENCYYMPNDYWEVEITQNEEECDDWNWYYNGEFLISWSLGEVSRYLEWFIYALEYYNINKDGIRVN